MKHLRWLVLGCVVLASCAAPEAATPPTEMVLKNLLEQPLDSTFVKDREVVVSLVEIPPNTTLERHWHPGEEFHYYLDGKVTIEIEGQPPIIGLPGHVGHVPFRKMHTAITGKEGARALVFRVHTTGAPVRYLEGGGTAER